MQFIFVLCLCDSLLLTRSHGEATEREKKISIGVVSAHQVNYTRRTEKNDSVSFFLSSFIDLRNGQKHSLLFHGFQIDTVQARVWFWQCQLISSKELWLVSLLLFCVDYILTFFSCFFFRFRLSRARAKPSRLTMEWEEKARAARTRFQHHHRTDTSASKLHIRKYIFFFNSSLFIAYFSGSLCLSSLSLEKFNCVGFFNGLFWIAVYPFENVVPEIHEKFTSLFFCSFSWNEKRTNLTIKQKTTTTDEPNEEMRLLIIAIQNALARRAGV